MSSAFSTMAVLCFLSPYLAFQKELALCLDPLKCTTGVLKMFWPFDIVNVPNI